MKKIYDTIKLNKLLKSGSLNLLNNFSIHKYYSSDRDNFDSIYLNKKEYKILNDKVFLLVNEETNNYVVCYPKLQDKKILLNKKFKGIKPNQIILSKCIYDSLRIDSNSNFDSYIKIYELTKINYININKCNVQIFKDIKEEKITISSKYKYLLKNSIKFFVIKNLNNNSRFIISTNHIVFSDDLNETTIRMNRKQRIMLDIDEKKNINLLLFPYPNIESNNFTFLNNIYYKFLKFYVGKVNIALLAKRTYQSDETFNIVRISSDIMKVLGISDTDVVKITYLNKSCNARVLQIDDVNKIIEQNSEKGALDIKEIENIICIPANLRNELGILSVKSNIAVKVERDMGYIFKKNFNQQILPIILILFSTEIFVNGRELFIKILIALISLPITLYFNLSNERAITE